MSSSNDSVIKTIVVAVALSLACSVLVSAAAVLLRPDQIENKNLDRRLNILTAAGLIESADSLPDDLQPLFDRLEPRIVDMETGEYVEMDDPESYDQRKASKDPSMSEVVPSAADIANIKRRADKAQIYLVKSPSGELESIILPVHGYGLWSTMYGYLALKPDTKTVVGLKFYEQKETPGLGGEIDNPDWLSTWKGKVVYDQNFDPEVQLVKGGVNPNNPQAQHQVDALSGATLTGNGVQNLMEYWLGEEGFAPYLTKLREGESNNG